jgi:hypothetical protein
MAHDDSSMLLVHVCQYFLRVDIMPPIVEEDSL